MTDDTENSIAYRTIPEGGEPFSPFPEGRVSFSDPTGHVYGVMLTGRFS